MVILILTMVLSRYTAPKNHGNSYHGTVPWYTMVAYHGVPPQKTMVHGNVPWYFFGRAATVPLLNIKW